MEMAQGHRNREIDDFLSSFGVWDWLYLRSKARHAHIDCRQLATFTDLPVDVLVLIAAHISLSEAISCRLVSRAWRTLWEDTTVVRYLIQRCFPGALQFLNQSIPEHKLLLDLVRQHSIPAGRKWSVHHVPWSRSTVVSSETARRGVGFDLPTAGADPNLLQFKYAAGKVAWQMEPSFVVIDDLVQGTWQRVSFVLNRLRGGYSMLVGFSGPLLLVGYRDGMSNNDEPRSEFRKIVVHHVASNTQRMLNLPNTMTKCFTDQERVVFLGRRQEVFTYNWGGALQQVKVSFDEDQAGCPNSSEDLGCILRSVLFHPFQPDTMFLVWESAASAFPETSESSSQDVEDFLLPSRIHKPKEFHSTVMKYQHAQKMREQKLPLKGSEILWNCSQANNFGLHTICTLSSGIPGTQVYDMYNVVTETFHRVEVDQVDGHAQSASDDCCIWNSHILGCRRISNDAGYCLTLHARKVNCGGRPASYLQQDTVQETVWTETDSEPRSAEGRPLAFKITLDVSEDFTVINSYSNKGYVVLSRRNLEIRLRRREDALDDG